MDYLLSLKDISLHYMLKQEKINILNNISLKIKKNERVSIIGESGSGKTSLLMIMAGLQRASDGSMFFENYNFTKIPEEQITEIRKSKIGMIFQDFYLIPNYSALENVMFPLEINKLINPKKRAIAILDELGLGKKINNLPSELSGGEQQRVAIARSISFNPEIILADEPTGNLDAKNTSIVIKILFDYSKRYQKSLVLVTHDENLAKKSDKIIRIKDGEIEGNDW